MINWALAEQSLDFTAHTIYKECAGSTLQIGCALTHKFEFLKKALRTRAALQVYAEDGIKLLDRIATMSQKRHDLVRGVVVSIKSINRTSPVDKLDY